MQRKAQFAGIIFYIFISILLVTLAIPGTLAIFPVVSLPLSILYIVFFAAHIGLYWLNLKYHQNGRWSVSYYLLQVVLIIVLASFPYDRDSIRISILSSTAMCMIGESLGLWGNTRRALFLGLFYGGLAVTLLFFVVEREVFLSAVGSLFFNSLFIILFMIVLNQQFAEREKAEELAERLESANAQLAANAARIESLALQNERQRMARELHDTLAQGVAGLVLQLEAVKNHLQVGHNERALTLVGQALTRARGTLAESRAAIDDLRAGPVELTQAIREKVDRFTQATGIHCDLELSVQENQLAPEVVDHALHILSESLANITRHAQASQVRVRVFVQKDFMELEIDDNGQGFDVEEQSSSGHYGLLGMRERARLAGGTLTVESNAQRGTNVRFIVNNSKNGANQ